MLSSRFLAQVAVSFVLVLRANAESHVIKFVNQCGYGSPALMYNGQNILTSDTYTSNGPYSGIAYLQTGYCGANGENCTLLETTLINPTCAGCGSSTDISLIPPHLYSVKTSFAYYNGCNGQGKTCSSASCTSVAFFTPTDYYAQVGCEVDNVNLLVAFCADAAQFVAGNGTTTSGSSYPTSSLPTSSSTPSLGSSVPGSATPATSPTATTTRTNVLDNKSTTSSAPTPTPTATPSGSDFSDPGCEETGETTPPSTPTPTPMPTLTATPSGGDFSDPGCEETGETTPLSTPTSTPTPTPTVTPSSGDFSDPGCEDTGETTQSSPPTPTVSDPGSVLTQQMALSSPTPVTSTPTLSPTSTPTTSRRRCRPRPTGLTPSVSASTSPANTPTTTPTPTLNPTTTPAPSSAPVGTGTSTPDPCDDLGGPSTSSMPSTQRRRHRRTNRIHY